MKGNLATLKDIVFNKHKVPFYNRRNEYNQTIATVLDKEGLNTYIYSPNMEFTKTLKTWDELTEEDVSLLLEKLPELPIANEKKEVQK